MAFLRPVEYFLTRFHAKQELAWLAYTAGRDLVLPWGRRSGKSELFIEILIEDIETHGQDCLYVAKTQKQARKIVWKKLRARLRDNKNWRLKEGTLEAVHIPSGGTLYLYGADIVPDNMTGSGYRIIVCDEYALWKKPEIVQQILSPMLGDYGGQIFFGSTKRGKNHFHELHERAKREPDKYFCVEATIFDNTFLTDQGRAKVLSEYEGGAQNLLYQQEILNLYVVFQGMAFALEAGTYTEEPWHPADYDHSYHWRGLDHGYNPDPTACIWIAFNRRKGYFQVYAEYEESKLLIRQHTEVIKKSEERNFEDTISDVDPQVIAEYEAEGLPMTPAAKADKKARILRVVHALRTGKLKISKRCAKLLKTMASYEWDQDGNDHLIDALIMVFTNLTVPQLTEPTTDEFRPRSNTNQDRNQNFG
jgi:hypothetical protein